MNQVGQEIKAPYFEKLCIEVQGAKRWINQNGADDVYNRRVDHAVSSARTTVAQGRDISREDYQAYKDCIDAIVEEVVICCHGC